MRLENGNIKYVHCSAEMQIGYYWVQDLNTAKLLFKVDQY